MNPEKKDKLLAGHGSIVFHALLILLLFFLALKTPLPLPEEEGVEVDMGYSALGQTLPEKPIEKLHHLNPNLKLPERQRQASQQTQSRWKKKLFKQIPKKVPR